MGTRRRSVVLESSVRLVEVECVFRPSASVAAGASSGTTPAPAASSAMVFGSAVIVSCLCVKERITMCGCSGLCVNECAVWCVCILQVRCIL